jgi:multisubunit Na+/H+ antiporter MnhF subunit
MTQDWWPIGISAGALVVSVSSAVASYRLAHRQNSLQERLLALETARASVDT